MTALSTVRIGDRSVGPGEAVYMIAEAGVNHNGDPALARQLVKAAADVGADAVKFQSFRASRLVTKSAQKAAYQEQTTGTAGSQLEMLRSLELSPQVHRDLRDYAERLGVHFLSTPFDLSSLELLCKLGVPAIKVGSGDLNNLAFLAEIARKRRPVILSTGMSTLAEVRCAVTVLRREGCEQLVLLHCVTGYPSADEETNLLAMQTLREEFGVPTGFSDHTLGATIAVAAAALGANVIEKHMTLDRNLPGPDHQASAIPEEMADLVAQVRRVEKALGHGRKEPSQAERDLVAVTRRSVVAARALAAGTRLRREDLDVKRPGTGIPAGELDGIVGRRLRRGVEADEVLTWEMLDP